MCISLQHRFYDGTKSNFFYIFAKIKIDKNRNYIRFNLYNIYFHSKINITTTFLLYYIRIFSFV